MGSTSSSSIKEKADKLDAKLKKAFVKKSKKINDVQEYTGNFLPTKEEIERLTWAKEKAEWIIREKMCHGKTVNDALSNKEFIQFGKRCANANDGDLEVEDNGRNGQLIRNKSPPYEKLPEKMAQQYITLGKMISKMVAADGIGANPSDYLSEHVLYIYINSLKRLFQKELKTQFQKLDKTAESILKMGPPGATELQVFSNPATRDRRLAETSQEPLVPEASFLPSTSSAVSVGVIATAGLCLAFITKRFYNRFTAKRRDSFGFEPDSRRTSLNAAERMV